MARVRVASVAVNQCVGDWSGNRARLMAAIEQGRAAGATIINLPELACSGYSLGDRVLMTGTLRRSWEMVQDLASHTAGLMVSVGLPISHEGVLHNVVAMMADGQVVGVVPKENLATGDLQYESRWYEGWRRGHVAAWHTPTGETLPLGSLMFRTSSGLVVAVEVCEDAWMGSRPGSTAARAGAHVVLNASASWFVVGKHRVRRDFVRDISRADKCAYVFTSLMGCDATRLIFDGTSLVGCLGEICAEGPRFVFGEDVVVTTADISIDEILRARHGEGSWREQASEEAWDGALGEGPTTVEIGIAVAQEDVVEAPPAYWETANTPEGWGDASLAWWHTRYPHVSAANHAMVELELALAMGMSEYLRKTGVPGFALALSGGRDSALCAVLVQRLMAYRHPEASPEELRALVHEVLVTTYLATGHSGDATQRAAAALAHELGAEHLETQMQEAVDVHHRLAGEMMGTVLSWETPAHDITLQNVQARLRGSLVWMIANLKSRVLLTTSNLSEVAVGYTTMDGDTSGGLAPVANVPKSLLTAWLHWARDAYGFESLDFVLGTPATAELRPPDEVQTDEGDLMPFAVLDRLTDHFARLGEEPETLFKRLWPEFSSRYDGDAWRFVDHIEKFVRLFCRSQWKRERFAVSFRVMPFDLDPKSGFRFPVVQAPFREELEALRQYVRQAHGDRHGQGPSGSG